MNNLSSEQNKTMEAILNDYQEEISLSLTEIKKVITLLDSPIMISDHQQQLSERLALANQMITQTTERLEKLEQYSHSLKKQPHLSELENYGEIRELLTYQVEKIKQKTEQWQYSA